jgi:uncharacterized membrane protein
VTIGPVQLLVLAFDRPNFTGEIVRELVRLQENDMIRLVDSLVVQKGEDGELTAVQWSDLSIAEAQDMGALAGALIGIGEGGDEENVEAAARAGSDAGADGHLLDNPDVWDVAGAIPNGSAAAIALIEHVWAVPLRNAVVRAGGVAVSDEWVHPLDLIEIGLTEAAEPERV